MKRYTDVTTVRPAAPVLQAEPLRLAIADYLARFQGSSRDRADFDLRCYLAWRAGRGPDPLARADRTWSCTSGGGKKPAGSSPPPCPGGSQSPPGSTGPA